MCGIFGYCGNKPAWQIILKGLGELEYRGYDSAGIAIQNRNKIKLAKGAGRASNLAHRFTADKMSGNNGIGHTRWATHGKPNSINSHPHTDCHGKIFLVHNGIIENFLEIKKFLKQRGHKFISSTDTEVIPHLIEHYMKKSGNFDEALSQSLKRLTGAYAIALISKFSPGVIYATRNLSPLVAGINKNEKFLSSDPDSLSGVASELIYLSDGDIIKINSDSILVTDASGSAKKPKLIKPAFVTPSPNKNKSPTFMLKEIHEAPMVVTSFKDPAALARQKNKPQDISLVFSRLKTAKRLIILACGSSYYAGLMAEYVFEEISQLPTEVQLASEFKYRNEPLSGETIVLGISQSGETADTLSAIKKAKGAGLFTISMVNAENSALARESDAVIYNRAGPEIGVASTKAFISQLSILIFLAINSSKEKSNAEISKLLLEFEKIPWKMRKILSRASQIKKIAHKYKNYHNMLFIGRKLNYPIALEGALKLKEISYIHAEGYSAGEMKHGPIAMISRNFPTIAITPSNSVVDKMYSNIEEIKARNGLVLAIATDGNTKIKTLADDVFYIPPTLEYFEPMLAIIPLQLFAYYIGIKRGTNVDKPRNLAKSVTVE